MVVKQYRGLPQTLASQANLTTSRKSPLSAHKFKNLIASVKSLPMMVQLLLKNSAVNPSDRGALLSGMGNKAFFISSLVTDTVSSDAIAWGIED